MKIGTTVVVKAKSIFTGREGVVRWIQRGIQGTTVGVEFNGYPSQMVWRLEDLEQKGD